MPMTNCTLHLPHKNEFKRQTQTGENWTQPQISTGTTGFVDRYVDNMTTKDLVEYVYNDMMQYVENQPEQEFLDDCKDYWDDQYDDMIHQEPQ